MKISIEINHTIYTAQTTHPWETGHIDEVVQMLKGLLVSAGFHPNNVDDVFNHEDKWFYERDNHDDSESPTKEEVQEWQNNMYRQEDDKDFVF